MAIFATRYKVTFGRGSAPYLATLPTIFSEEEESGILNMNNNRTGAVNRNQLDSTSSDTMALSAEEVEEVVRLVLVGCQTCDLSKILHRRILTPKLL